MAQQQEGVMDIFKPLGKRDIFGIILPGAILIIAGAYSIFGILKLLRLWDGALLGQQFLLSILFLVAAYLTGNLLRLSAADEVDKMSSDYLVEVWNKKHQAKIENGEMPDFEKCKTELAKGGDVSNVPSGFDNWLSGVEKFPYPALQNRIWQAHGPREVLEFFRSNYKASMWSESSTSTKSFFNHCKLVVIGKGGPLADEVNMAEGLTRFFAGTVTAFRLSIRLLGATLIIQWLLIAALIFAPRLGIGSIFRLNAQEWIFQGFFLVFTLALIFISRWICQVIRKRFRRIRQKEAETVYHAFYLYSTNYAEETRRKSD
jgi:hypothetical protein